MKETVLTQKKKELLKEAYEFSLNHYHGNESGFEYFVMGVYESMKEQDKEYLELLIKEMEK